MVEFRVQTETPVEGVKHEDIPDDNGDEPDGEDDIDNDNDNDNEVEPTSIKEDLPEASAMDEDGEEEAVAVAATPSREEEKDDAMEPSSQPEPQVNPESQPEQSLEDQDQAHNGEATASIDQEDEDDPPTGPTLQVSVDDPPEGEDDADADDVDVDDQAGPTLQFTFQQNTDDHDVLPEDHEEETETENLKPPTSTRKRQRAEKTRDEKEEEYRLLHSNIIYEETDPQTIADKKIVSETKPESTLEHALTNLLAGKEVHISKLMTEITKLKGFISKRKQTYKRKRKDESAPTRALSAYNIFVQDQFEKLAKKNDAALQSTDTNAQMERVPPANLVAKTGGLWKNLPDDEKEKYRERAKRDRKRYEEQMGKYQPPDKQANRKRNKTGYNMFFSAHVTRLKQSEMGVPSERGSVARLVGTAWKQLSVEEKQYYEREADKHNGMNPVDKGDDEDDDKDGKKSTVDDVQQQTVQQQHAQQQAAAQQQVAAQVQDPYAAHAAAQYGAHDLSAATGYTHAMHQVAQQHDPRALHHAYYYPSHPGHPYHYDYAGHHAAQQQVQQQGGHPQHTRASRQAYQYGQHAPPHGYYDK